MSTICWNKRGPAKSTHQRLIANKPGNFLGNALPCSSNLNPRLSAHYNHTSMRTTPRWLNQLLLGIKVLRDLVVRQQRSSTTLDIEHSYNSLETLSKNFKQNLQPQLVTFLNNNPPDITTMAGSKALFKLLIKTDDNRAFLLQTLRTLQLGRSASIKNELMAYFNYTGIPITESKLDEFLTTSSNTLAFLFKLKPSTQSRLLQVMAAGGFQFIKKRCVKTLNTKINTADEALKNLANGIDDNAGGLLDLNQAVDQLWGLTSKLVTASASADSAQAMRQLGFQEFDTFKAILNWVTASESVEPTSTKFTPLELRVESRAKQLMDRALIPADFQSQCLEKIRSMNKILSSQTLLMTLLQTLSTKAILQTKVLNVLPAELWQQLTTTLVQSIDALKPYEAFPFYKKFADTLCNGLGDNPVVQDVARIMTKGYFSALTYPDKVQLISAILSQGGPKFTENGTLSDQSFSDLVLRMIQAGGPGFQKAMQLFKDDIPNPDLKNTLEQVSDSITPLPPTEVKAIIQQNFKTIKFKDNKSYQICDPSQYQQLKPDWPSRELLTKNHLKCLGSATIGQTHLAYLQEIVGQEINNQGQLQPQAVAIKIQRPGIVQKIQLEMKAMKRIEGMNPALQDTFSALEAGILAETDFNREAAFADYLAPIYSSFSSTSCKTQVVDILAAQKTMLIETFNTGKSIPAITAELKQAQSPLEYAAFLDNAAIGLSQLVSGFGQAAILGDQNNAYELRIGKPDTAVYTHSKSTNSFYIFKNADRWFCQNNEDYTKGKPPLPLVCGQNSVIQSCESFQPSGPSQSALALLTIENYSNLCQEIRFNLQQSPIFKGESFIDSDRHAGNMLYSRIKNGIDQLTVIDTGAGCIVTKQERKGMFQIATGVASTNQNLVFDGVKALIPSITRKPLEQQLILKNDIAQIIYGETIEQEKLHHIYQYLLRSGLMPGTESASEFFAAVHHNQNLKSRILNFDDATVQLQALKAFLVETPVADQFKNFDFKDYETRIKNANFERFFAINPSRSINPANWITDGENALLFVNTIRQIAKVLNRHQVAAPDVVVQVNRGTQCIENQLRFINQAKAELLAENKQEHNKIIPSLQQQLQPTHLGPAYIKGVLSSQIIKDELSLLSVGELTSALSSFTWERIKAIASTFRFYLTPAQT